jgi:hypothetical protein
MQEPDARQHDGDDGDLEEKPDAPGQAGGEETPEQRPDRGGNRRRCPDQGVGLLLRGAFEVAVDQDACRSLHG